MLKVYNNHISSTTQHTVSEEEKQWEKGYNKPFTNSTQFRGSGPSNVFAYFNSLNSFKKLKLFSKKSKNLSLVVVFPLPMND